MSRYLQKNASTGQQWAGYVRCTRYNCARGVMLTPPELLDQELLDRPMPQRDPNDRTWFGHRSGGRQEYLNARAPQHGINHNQPLPDGWHELDGAYQFCSWRCLALWAQQSDRKGRAA